MRIRRHHVGCGTWPCLVFKYYEKRLLLNTMDYIAFAFWVCESFGARFQKHNVLDIAVCFRVLKFGMRVW